jgi:hypothetical protein
VTSSQLIKPEGVGLALGAGGARGLAHIVVLEALDELGVKPVAIAGSSIGAVIGAAVGAGFSAADNVRAYRRGEVDGTRAAANVIVDGAIGAGAALSGAGIGAAVGSVAPVVGTAAGAALGFAAGTIGAWLVQWSAYHYGAADQAKRFLDLAMRRFGHLLHLTWKEAGIEVSTFEQLLVGLVP